MIRGFLDNKSKCSQFIFVNIRICSEKLGCTICNEPDFWNFHPNYDPSKHFTILNNHMMLFIGEKVINTINQCNAFFSKSTALLYNLFIYLKPHVFE